MDEKMKELIISTLGEQVYKDYYEGPADMGMGGMPTSFAQMLESKQAHEVSEQVYDLSNMFRMLAFNITCNDMIEDKTAALKSLADEFINLVEGATAQAKSSSLLDLIKELNPFHSKEGMMKTEGGKKFPMSAYAHTPSDKPSTWKLRMMDMSGKVTKEQLGAAAAAFSSGGFRGNKVQMPAADVAKAKARIRSEYRKLGVPDKEIPDSVKELDGIDSFMVFKDANNQMRWSAIHTNKYEDSDNPPEIIASFAHKEFVEAVDTGRAPYPELWVWHASQASKAGKADLLHYDEDTGFLFSTGTFDHDKEHIAKGLAEYPYPLRTSHGMPKESLIYEGGLRLDELKPKANGEPYVIVHYRTREISPLPYGAEANKLSMFAVQGG